MHPSQRLPAERQRCGSTMKLSDLAGLVSESKHFGRDIEVGALVYDSRRVEPNSLFVALRGAHNDGHEYLADVTTLGAVAVAVNADRAAWAEAQGYNGMSLPDTRLALPQVAAAFYGEPSRHLTLIGVTGTNGKTTTSFMIDSILRAWGVRTGIVGTIGAFVDGRHVPQERTTPEAPDLQKLFAEMRDQGVTHVVMEVSSEGVLQERTSYCAFDYGVFTNLTQDHLNTHGTMEAYFSQKLRLFTEYPDAYPEKPFTSIVNSRDPYAQRVIEAIESTGRSAITFGLDDPYATVRAEIREVRSDGTQFDMYCSPSSGEEINIPMNLPIGGVFNVSNALAAASVALQLGVPPARIVQGLEALSGVPGRFEPIPTGDRGFHVVVDYAHTPDGLKNVLESARALNPARLISVFGCGGDRDKPKRPLMGRISAEIADVTVVTSDNPRTENPDAIIAGILDGIAGGAANPGIVVEADRREAIRRALCELAKPGDLVVIAGKGHETVQIFADHKIHFDDREVAREALASCG